MNNSMQDKIRSVFDDSFNSYLTAVKQAIALADEYIALSAISVLDEKRLAKLSIELSRAESDYLTSLNGTSNLEELYIFLKKVQVAQNQSLSKEASLALTKLSNQDVLKIIERDINAASTIMSYISNSRTEQIIKQLDNKTFTQLLNSNTVYSEPELLPFLKIKETQDRSPFIQNLKNSLPSLSSQKQKELLYSLKDSNPEVATILANEYFPEFLFYQLSTHTINVAISNISVDHVVDYLRTLDNAEARLWIEKFFNSGSGKDELIIMELESSSDQNINKDKCKSNFCNAIRSAIVNDEESTILVKRWLDS